MEDEALGQRRKVHAAIFRTFLEITANLTYARCSKAAHPCACARPPARLQPHHQRGQPEGGAGPGVVDVFGATRPVVVNSVGARMPAMLLSDPDRPLAAGSCGVTCWVISDCAAGLATAHSAVIGIAAQNQYPVGAKP